MTDEPEDALGDGPFIWIPVLQTYLDVVPKNATRLLREWERTVTPIDSLREALEKAPADLFWLVEDHFVEPTVETALLMRHAVDSGIKDEIIDSPIRVGLRPRSTLDADDRRDFAHGASYREFPMHLDPLLYGLAVYSVLRGLPGYHSSQVNERHQNALADQTYGQMSEFTEQLKGLNVIEPDDD